MMVLTNEWDVWMAGFVQIDNNMVDKMKDDLSDGQKKESMSDLKSDLEDGKRDEQNKMFDGLREDLN